MNTTESDLHRQLAGLDDTIEALMKIGGTAGLSLGVQYKGQERYYKSFGHRDVANKLPVTHQTVFPICSLTKLFTAMAVGVLMDDNVRWPQDRPSSPQWDTPIKELLPELASLDVLDDRLWADATVEDLLHHTTGLSNPSYYRGTSKSLLLHAADIMPFLQTLSLRDHFERHRKVFSYSDLGYKIAGLVVEALTNDELSWSDVVQDKLFRPLGMTRSFTQQPPSDTPNVSKAYNTLSDGTPFEIHREPTDTMVNTFNSASGGIFSSVEDLLNAYVPLNQSRASRQVLSSAFPVPRVQRYFTPPPESSMEDSKCFGSYAMGLAKVTLPGRIGFLGRNIGLLSPHGMPIVATGSPPREVFYHQGCAVGALCAMAMIPSMDVVVVVLTNSYALNDCADWVLQLVLEEILTAPFGKTDFITLAEASALRSTAKFNSLVSALNMYPRPAEVPSHLRPAEVPSHLRSRPVQPPLSQFVGDYEDTVGIMDMNISLEGEHLTWALRGLDTERFRLYHHDGNTFHWLGTRDDMLKRGMLVDHMPQYFKIEFHGEEGKRGLRWGHDSLLADPEEFVEASEEILKEREFWCPPTEREKQVSGNSAGSVEHNGKALPESKCCQLQGTCISE